MSLSETLVEELAMPTMDDYVMLRCIADENARKMRSLIAGMEEHESRMRKLDRRLANVTMFVALSYIAFALAIIVACAVLTSAPF